MTDNKGVYENMLVPITTQHIVLQLQKLKVVSANVDNC